MSGVQKVDRCGIDGHQDDSDIVLEPGTPEAWKRVWRVGLAPQFTIRGLEGLKLALEQDRRSLITGATMQPPPLMCMQHEAVEACCPLCYALLDGMRPEAVSVGPLEEHFAEACFRADQLCGEPAAVRYFLNWTDETPRDEMRKQLLIEVNLALIGRLPADQASEPTTPLARQLAYAGQQDHSRNPDSRRSSGMAGAPAS
jgi:hypothetical protein